MSIVEHRGDWRGWRMIQYADPVSIWEIVPNTIGLPMIELLKSLVRPRPNPAPRVPTNPGHVAPAPRVPTNPGHVAMTCMEVLEHSMGVKNEFTFRHPLLLERQPITRDRSKDTPIESMEAI